MSVTKEILDGYSVELFDDEPCAKEWIVYDSQGEDIVGIQAHYKTTSNYHHGFMSNDRRTGPVREWVFDFHTGTDTDSDLMDSIERHQHQHHFKTIVSAFKWAVMVFEEYKAAKALKDNEQANNLHRRVEVCHCGRLLASHDNDSFRVCMIQLHEAGIPDGEHDDLVEVIE